MRKKTFFLALVIINMILLSIAGIVFGSYMKKSNETAMDESMKGFQNDSANLSDRFELYLQSNEMVVDTIAAYIDEEKLDLEEVSTFLKYQQVNQGYITLVDADTLQGTVYTNMSRTSMELKPVINTDESISVNYSICEEIAAINENDQGPETGSDADEKQNRLLHMTDVFSDNISDTNVVAFYRNVEIEGKKYLVLYICNANNMVSEGLSGQIVEGREGILINRNGEFISESSMYKASSDYKNYYSAIAQTNGQDISDSIRAQIADNVSGSFEIKGLDGKQWIYTYETIEDANGWVYIYSQSGSTLYADTGYTTSSIIIMIIMAVIMVLNVGAVLHYYRMIKKDLSTAQVENEGLHSAVAEAEEANAAKSAFLSNVSHEIRTPINAVLGLDELIIRETNEVHTKEYAYDIKNAGRTLLSLVNDILDFSKIESGKMEIIDVNYELGSTLNDIYHMIGVKANEKGLGFQIGVKTDIPHLLHGDEIRIKQIVMNLLTNAVKYTEKGTVKLKMSGTKVDDHHIKLCVSVTDTGIGLKPDEVDKLFNPFERLEEKRNRSIEGTGLGMSIVKELLDLMGSQLEVESTYGEGSSFSFEVIQEVNSWEPVGDFQERYRQLTANEDEYKELFASPEARILVVDDTPMNLTVIKGLLKRTKVKLDTADSGKNCIELLKNHSYHMIFMDHRMPEMDGIETLMHIRNQHLCDDTPIIALTANAISGAKEEYIAFGFADFLGKPVDGEKLEKMIVKYLPEELIKKEEHITIGDNEENKSCRLPIENWNTDMIDARKGIQYCGGYDLYEQVMKEYCSSLHVRIDELNQCLDQKDMKNYTIKVHGMKSAVRMIGAEQLSAFALELEQAGNRMDLEYIQSHHEEFCNELQKIQDLVGNFYQSNSENKSEIAIEELKEALAALKESNEAYDFDSIDEIISELDDCMIPEYIQKEYEILKQNVRDVDSEKIREQISNLESII